MSYYGGFPDRYLASQPWRLHFAGWETDTYRLQQNGWQLSALQDVRHDSVQVAFQHPEYKIRGVSDHIRLYDARALMGMGNMRDGPTYIETRACLATDFVSNSARFIAPMGSFKPIDAEPQLLDMHHMMSRNMIFAPNLARTQEIIVPEQSVDDLLNMMLDKQAVNRAELIRKRVREQGQTMDFNPRTHVHAQIISIAV